MLMQKKSCGLLLVDVQEKLTPHVMHADTILSRCAWLMRLANTLQVPIVLSEQYPSGLGKTVEPLRALAPLNKAFEKVHFSCYRNEELMTEWKTLGKQQVVLIGIETHVCVLQTALDLTCHSDLEVFVVVDAVGSRSEMDHKYGLKRMKQAGVELVTSEMVFFEWVEQAGTPEFKALSQSFLR